MRITSKGQVTIPIDIRERLGLLPHTEVVFEVERDSVRLRKADAQTDGRGERLVRRLRGKATVEMSTDEILGLTRGDS
jgi:AbrB family looped-hinge helix DNA binding protein